MDDIKEKIIKGALEEYKKKGAKFTMDDLAATLGMSKKTIYAVIPDKRTLFSDMVNFVFDKIKEGEDRIMSEKNIPTDERLRRILGIMPDIANGMDFTKIYSVKEKYAEAYGLIVRRLESEWGQTLMILNQGVEEGVFRPVDAAVFQMIFEASLERFLNGSELEQNHISYVEALNELVDIMINGIRAKNAA